jgi:FAD binding domain/Berberine and berberine like
MLKGAFAHVQSSIQDPVSVQALYWQNNSCSPFTSPNSSCTLGNLASYTINISSPADVVAGFQFAKENNIRLSVKNTGHDYIGRSAGQGSLGLWMNHLKGVSFFDYNSTYYTGPAARLNAGVQAYELYQAAAQNGVRVVGGFCPTVGLAGGYVQGAGHGPLASTYGLAANNTLEYEVVTANGQHLTATPTQNSDLYWALSGGGGGTYAVVLSQTTKSHPDGPVGGASLSFNNTGDDTYWSAIGVWQENLLALDGIDGFQSVYRFTNRTFAIDFVTWPGASASDVAVALNPFVVELEKSGIDFVFETSGSQNYYAHYAMYTAGLPLGVFRTNDVIGGRLISRSSVQDNNEGLIALFRNITADGRFMINSIASNVTQARVGSTPGPNAVLPAWRESLSWLNVVTSWDPSSPIAQLHEIMAELNEYEYMLKLLTPGSGAYMNEARFNNPDWKADFYGVNYDGLLGVKKKYDPDFMLYGPAAVGHDYWIVAADGRLCKAE